MRVCVALEQRFLRLPDGSIWAPAVFGPRFWHRYLEVFDRVRCVARVGDVAGVDAGWQRVDNEAVAFGGVPHYVGPAQFVRQARLIRRAVRRAVQPGDAFVLRVPGVVGRLAWAKLRAANYPYAVEVVGDPYDVFSPGAVRHPLRPFFRWLATRDLKRQCAQASAASYVTSQALQRRYPSVHPAVAASSIELLDDAFTERPRVFSSASRPARLIFVGSLEQYYKAPDVLIASVVSGLRRGLNLTLTMVGDGKHRGDLERLAAQSGAGRQIRFTGQLAAGAAIRAELDRADMFVLPSRQEGLPRAMIEAMARGLPCVGSTVGGIPELLPPDALVPPGDETALADKLESMVLDPARLTRMSARNLEQAKAYGSAVLQARRVRFYRRIRETTETWLSRHQQESLD